MGNASLRTRPGGLSPLSSSFCGPGNAGEPVLTIMLPQED